MSRSLVKRGLACRTTATPPTITKSTPASLRRRSRLPSLNVGWSSEDSDTTTTAPRARSSECLCRRMHLFQSAQPLRGRKLELLADEALIDAARARRSLKLQAVAGRPERCGEGLEGGVRAQALQLRNRSLGDAETERELSLGEPGSAP